MTNSPEAPTPDSNPADTERAAVAFDAAPTPPAAAPLEADQVRQDDHDPAVFTGGAFDRIVEPRSENRLPLGDGTWYQLAKAYVRVQLITTGFFFLLVLVAGLVAVFAFDIRWLMIPAGILLVILAAVLVVTPRQARSYGYQLRRDDLVFRRGILWQRIVAVPYGRMQLVDITHGPLDRGFGIAQLKIVTAAAVSGVTLPGLTQEAAEQLRDTLIDVAETRRTGL
ncbi:PH domain-containing protein [Microbacterium sp. ET2]|uniref:PH domain-containing protein n=1 Tax=Microbacterium albipurpureum TaxID=3050384 RepID=UPI00259C9A82|nr:PH domain-containing protein [Microbacterium sp. ET2 (Ac-2212)]WJL97088.1 PH domain-containing protein [Microbacterium sp. ET2 (Ac-2212)]